MRVLVIRASGAIGTRLVPQLRARGHQVTGTTRSPGKAGQLRALGADPAVLDANHASVAPRLTSAAAIGDIVVDHTYAASAYLLATKGLRPVDREPARPVRDRP